MCRLIILLAALVSSVNCANILGLMAVPSPSHHHFNSALMHELGRRGHNVTILSVDVPKPTESIPNVHYIHLENVYEHLYGNSTESLDITDYFGMYGVAGVPMYYQFADETIPGVYTSKGFFELLNYPDNFKFDLVIYDYSIGSFLLGFLEKFDYPPLVGVSPFLNPPITVDYSGCHMFPSYIPHWLTVYDVNMNFLERFENTIVYYWDFL